MRITKKVIKEVDEVVATQCHKCGIWFESNINDTTQSFNIEFNQASKYEYPWGVTLCETCLEKIVKEFLIVPDNFMGEKSHVPAFISDHELHQNLFDEWKISGEWNYDENPWKSYYSSDNANQDNESCEEYEQYYEWVSDAIEIRKPLHINIVRLATVYEIGLAKRWCEDND